MSLLKKGTKVYGMWNMKCPRCQEADLFPTGSFEFNKPFDMNKECPNCKEDLFPEPGFYYGAMFISYIFMGWFCLAFVAILHWIFDWGLNSSFGMLLLVCAIFYAWIFRMARSIWVNISIKYKPDAA